MLSRLLDFNSILFQLLAFSLQPFQFVPRADVRNALKDCVVVDWVTGFVISR